MKYYKNQILKKLTDKEKQMKRKMNSLLDRFLAAIMIFLNKLKQMFASFAVTMGRELGKLMAGLANKINQQIGEVTKNILKF